MTTRLEIQNLKCGGCANTITTKLSNLEFVENVKINNEDSSVSFTYTNKEILPTIKRLLFKLGYPEIGDKNEITTKAKSFVSCAIGRINKPK